MGGCQGLSTISCVSVICTIIYSIGSSVQYRKILLRGIEGRSDIPLHIRFRVGRGVY